MNYSTFWLIQYFNNNNDDYVDGKLNESYYDNDGDEFDENEFGDKFIREARLTREQETRLKAIESQLEKLKSIRYSRE